MGLFSNLFGKKKAKLSLQAFFQNKEVKALIEKYSRKGTLLRPHKSPTAIPPTESKFGGIANMNGFETYPCCDACNSPLNFVLQLYKKDFPNHYYPEGMDLSQIFRCPYLECPEAFSDRFDQKTFVYYYKDSRENKVLVKPKPLFENIEADVPDCFLKPEIFEDLPNRDDVWEKDYYSIESKFGMEATEFIDQRTIESGKNGTKSGGYPRFTQYAHYPVCDCGKTKEFFFQLSSEDLEEGVKNPPSPEEWSSHGIMMGDVGNMYFYVCKSCGPNTVETYWDC